MYNILHIVDGAARSPKHSKRRSNNGLPRQVVLGSHRGHRPSRHSPSDPASETERRHRLKRSIRHLPPRYIAFEETSFAPAYCKTQLICNTFHSVKDPSGAASWATPVIDLLNDYTKKLERSSSGSAQIPTPRSADCGSCRIVRPTFARATGHGRAEGRKLLGLDYDAMHSRVIEQRILNHTSSKDENEANSSDKGLDQSIYDENLSLIGDNLNIEAKIVQNIKEKITSDADLEKRKQQIATRSAHLQAGVYLSGLIIGAVVGPEAAQKISTVSNGLVQIDQALQQFGPGGLTPDKLLMCSNLVGAGMVVAQAFTKQEDPTMAALQSIMSQLKDIKEQLDQIEGKIDRLTGTVLEGFDRVLKQENVLKNQIASFEQKFVNNIADLNQKRGNKQLSRLSD